MEEETKLFLETFPIEKTVPIGNQKRLYLKDASQQYRVDLSIVTDSRESEVQISSAIAHEGYDQHLLPRLRLMRNLYNTISAKLEEEGFTERMNSDQVLKPNFHLAVTQQEAVKGQEYEAIPCIFDAAYARLVDYLMELYGLDEVKVEEDPIHETKQVLTPFEHYGIEIAKPITHFPEFRVTADELTDYSRLKELSAIVESATKSHLSNVVKFFGNEPRTDCLFWINVDLNLGHHLTPEEVNGHLGI